MKDKLFFMEEIFHSLSDWDVDSNSDNLILKQNLYDEYSHKKDMNALNKPICVSHVSEENRLYDSIYGEEFSMDDDWRKEWITSDWASDFKAEFDDVHKTIQEVERDIEQIKEECYKVTMAPKTLLEDSNSKLSKKKKHIKFSLKVIKTKISKIGEKLLDIFIYE